MVKSIQLLDSPMDNLPAEMLSQIAMLATTCMVYRDMQLAHVKFDRDPRKQLWTRDRFRTWHEKPQTTHTCLLRLQILPSGRYDGLTMTFYDNKLRGRGYFVGNFYHGIYGSWYESGSLKERCVYRYGQLHGEYMFWSCSGIIRAHCKYEFGIHCGKCLM